MTISGRIYDLQPCIDLDHPRRLRPSYGSQRFTAVLATHESAEVGASFFDTRRAVFFVLIPPANS